MNCRVIDDFPAYSVCDDGTVRSHARCSYPRRNDGGNINQTKKLRVSLSRRGYASVRLYSYGVEKSFYVHRLVAQAFKPNPGCSQPYRQEQSQQPRQ